MKSVLSINLCALVLGLTIGLSAMQGYAQPMVVEPGMPMPGGGSDFIPERSLGAIAYDQQLEQQYSDQEQFEEGHLQYAAVDQAECREGQSEECTGPFKPPVGD